MLQTPFDNSNFVPLDEQNVPVVRHPKHEVSVRAQPIGRKEEMTREVVASGVL